MKRQRKEYILRSPNDDDFWLGSKNKIKNPKENLVDTRRKTETPLQQASRQKAAGCEPPSYHLKVGGNHCIPPLTEREYHSQLTV